MLKIQVVEVLQLQNNVLLIDTIIGHVHGLMVHAKIRHVIMQELKILVMTNVQLTPKLVLVRLIMLRVVKIELVKMLLLQLIQILDVKIIFQIRIVSPKRMVDALPIQLVKPYK